MMKKIKILKAFSSSDLEVVVNKWLESEGDNIIILDIKYDNNHEGSTQLMIITYETKESNKSVDYTLEDIKALVDRYYSAGRGIVGEPKISMRSAYWCRLLEIVGAKDEQNN